MCMSLYWFKEMIKWINRENGQISHTKGFKIFNADTLPSRRGSLTPYPLSVGCTSDCFPKKIVKEEEQEEIYLEKSGKYHFSWVVKLIPTLMTPVNSICSWWKWNFFSVILVPVSSWEKQQRNPCWGHSTKYLTSISQNSQGHQK